MRVSFCAADTTTEDINTNNHEDNAINMVHHNYSVSVNVRDLGAVVNLGSDGEEDERAAMSSRQPGFSRQSSAAGSNDSTGPPRVSLDSGYESDRDFLPLHWEHPDSTTGSNRHRPGRITSRRLNMTSVGSGSQRDRRVRRRQRRDTGIHRVQDPLVSSINVAEALAEENELVAELRRQRTTSNSSTGSGDSGFSEDWTWRMEEGSDDEEQEEISSSTVESTQDMLSGLRREFAQNLTMVSLLCLVCRLAIV